MLIEQCSYNNRWRQVSPAAKALFAACGIVAAFLARSPGGFCCLAGIMATMTVGGAGVPVLRYLKVAFPAVLFLAVSAATLAVSVGWDASPLRVHLNLAQPAELNRVAMTCGRSLCCMAALLFVSLTTPLTHIIWLLRRLKVPDVLLDIMSLGYRTIFVFLEVIHDTRTAQNARLGYATPRLALSSLGILLANLTVHVWQRSTALHQAALARNCDGTLLFIEEAYDRPYFWVMAASTGGCALVVLAGVLL